MSGAAGSPSGRVLSTDGNSRRLFLAPRKRLHATAKGDDLPTEPSELRRRPGPVASQRGRFDASCAAPAPIGKVRTRKELSAMSQTRQAGSPSNWSRNGDVRAPTSEQEARIDEQAESLGSLDMDTLSDMLEKPEKAEIATVFALSTRWRMQPRKCKCGIQRTHLAAPGRTRDAVSASVSALELLLGVGVGSIPRLHVRVRCVGRSRGCHVSLTVSQASPGFPRSVLARPRRGDCARIGSDSTGGTGIAYPIEQLIPRLGMGSQNREGARR